MRLAIAAAIAALPFTSTANAANIYMACWYQDDMGTRPVTQLFTLKGDAIGDSYPTWNYDGIKEWEAQFAKEPGEVRSVSSYTTRNIVGQFAKFAEEHGDSHSNCWVTTMKDHALAWFAEQGAKAWMKMDASSIADWRPRNAGVVAVSDWSGNPSGGALEAEAEEAEANAEKTAARDTGDGASSSAPRRPKMTNAEADAKYEADMAEYDRKLAEQRKQVEDFKRAEDEVARRKQEQKLAADRAAADYQRQLDAHAQTVRNQQLEYQRQIMKPADAPSAVYRGFWGPDCDAARKSATMGAGTSVGTMFKEVTNEPGPGRGCTVQGWWWNTGKGTASRQ
jgi:hypothetical protein